MSVDKIRLSFDQHNPRGYSELLEDLKEAALKIVKDDDNRGRLIVNGIEGRYISSQMKSTEVVVTADMTPIVDSFKNLMKEKIIEIVNQDVEDGNGPTLTSTKMSWSNYKLQVRLRVESQNTDIHTVHW